MLGPDVGGRAARPAPPRPAHGHDRTHFARSLARGEPVSALFAAEHAIYGRYGYGSAADDVRVKIARGAALRDVAGRDGLTVRLATADVAVHSAVVDEIHRAGGAGRPGWTTRDSDAWRTRAVVDPPEWRDGGEPLRIVTVHDAAGAVRAYALFRRKENWAEGGSAGSVKVREAVALDPAATHALWSFLLDLDLTATVEGPMLPVDDALLHLLVDPRAIVPKVNDNLWIRLLDLPVALAGRRYAAPVDVVLDVTDARGCPRTPVAGGGGNLAAEADGTFAATVVRTHEAADLRLDVPRARHLLPGRWMRCTTPPGRSGGRGVAGLAAVRGRGVPLAGRAVLLVRLVFRGLPTPAS